MTCARFACAPRVVNKDEKIERSLQMYCPKCGQSQVSAEVRFCSRCGFPLVVVGDLLATGGVLPARVSGYEDTGVRPVSPRRRGVKKGIGLLIISILLIPFFAIMHE